MVLSASAISSTVVMLAGAGQVVTFKHLRTSPQIPGVRQQNIKIHLLFLGSIMPALVDRKCLVCRGKGLPVARNSGNY